MNDLVSLAKALSDRTRVRILALLLREELCVCELTDVLSVGQSTLSTHLQTLRACGAVETEKRRTWTIYRISANKRDLINNVLDSAASDPVILSDLDRLSHRLHLRVDGCCVISRPALAKEAINVN